MTDMSKLLDRLKKATGPDRELDAEIWAVFCFPQQWSLADFAFGQENGFAALLDQKQKKTGGVSWRANGPEKDWVFGCLGYTASVDVSLALMSKVAPGGLLDLTLGYEPGSPDRAWPAVSLRFYPDGVLVDGKQWHCAIESAASPALAILAALIATVGSQP